MASGKDRKAARGYLLEELLARPGVQLRPKLAAGRVEGLGAGRSVQRGTARSCCVATAAPQQQQHPHQRQLQQHPYQPLTPARPPGVPAVCQRLQHPRQHVADGLLHARLLVGGHVRERVRDAQELG